MCPPLDNMCPPGQHVSPELRADLAMPPTYQVQHRTSIDKSCAPNCILIAARWLKEQMPGQGGTLRLFAVGDAGIPALHAAALEPDLFQSAKLSHTLRAWAGMVHTRLAELPISQVVHGALATYDLPDLAATLGRETHARFAGGHTAPA